MSAARLGFTKAEDELLAKGWPHMVRLLDDHRHDHAPEKFALAAVQATEPLYYTDWPRGVATRFLRTGCVTEFKDGAGRGLSSKTEAALADPRPLGKAEAKRLLYEAVVHSEEGTDFKVRDFVYGIEAVVGADEALDALCSGLEHSKLRLPGGQAAPMHTVFKGHASATAGFLLLRASAAVRKDATKRLEALRERFEQTKDDAWEACAVNLDLAVGGSAAVKRAFAGRTLDLGMVEYAHDDPAFVRKCLGEDLQRPITVRHAVIAGPKVIETVADRKNPPDTLPALLRDFGMIKSPQTVALLLSASLKSSAKDVPTEWFEAHADYARPHLEKLAKGSSKASAKAKAMLRRLEA